MKPAVQIGIIGAGRAGGALALALARSGSRITAIGAREPAAAATLAARAGAAAMTPAEVAARAELVFLATSDNAIAEVCATIAAAGGWRPGQRVVHCSGALGREALAAAAAQGAHTGAMHPLQTLPDAETGAARLAGSFFGIEAAEPLRAELYALAQQLGGHPFDLAGIDRAAYHAAAAIVANYSVALYAVGVELLERIGVAPGIAAPGLLALLNGAVGNLDRGAEAALTGPIARGDVATIAQHLAALERAAPEWISLYCALAHAALPLAQARGLSPAAAHAIGALIDGHTNQHQ
jgi:predicted short-subunit dehydrogenase-like oxidoreductase (DUF2520 family)